MGALCCLIQMYCRCYCDISGFWCSLSAGRHNWDSVLKRIWLQQKRSHVGSGSPQFCGKWRHLHFLKWNWIHRILPRCNSYVDLGWFILLFIFMSERYNGAFLPCDSPLFTDPSPHNCLNQLNWHVTSTSRDAAGEHHKYATLCSSSASYTDPPQPLKDTELYSLILYKCADSIHQ